MYAYTCTCILEITCTYTYIISSVTINMYSIVECGLTSICLSPNTLYINRLNERPTHSVEYMNTCIRVHVHMY